MNELNSFYRRSLKWSQHKHARACLYGMSFAESIFWPIPVDLMFAPLALSRPDRALILAFWTTFFSVVGALVGYGLGHLLFEPVVAPMVELLGYQEQMAFAAQWFQRWGFWMIFIAGFSPLPFKVFTISAGLFGIAIVPFIIMALLGRSLRFYVLAGLIKWGGKDLKRHLVKNALPYTWLMLFIAIACILLLG
ncbi:YqaA family protein [Motilimonas pumila]|uniref:DedA family protein n=1 Tax=Motilimonas pumila TaxID=2303987 RepID=A0A418YAK4_9GAMM|nr:YqaA family protein [Motilimonas pumila]RJG39994.1 DedA family protein [Motilimonas pumila]